MNNAVRALTGFIKWMIIFSLMWIGVIALLSMILVQPTFKHYPATRHTVAPDRLREHVYALAIDNAPRNYRHLWNLDASARYISDQFEKAGGRISEQAFSPEEDIVPHAKTKTYRNVIASFGPESGARIIVGAHYDTCDETPGADDNASGVSGLIELAYLLGRVELRQRVDLVAYTLEEPPYFQTSDMGSARHAAALAQDGVEVTGMICLEMIGYFSDDAGSQHFPPPAGLLSRFYPDQGNYIGIVGGFRDRKLIRQVKASMRGATDLPVHAMCALHSIAGMDLSDHMNYWEKGYTAVMVTDTSFYRNRNYHTLNDTPDTLDYERMSKAVLGVYEAVVRLANDGD